LIKDLDDDRFSVRDKASRELAELGHFAEPSLKKVLDRQPSLETRKRVEELLRKLEEAGPSPEELRVLRAVEVLEMIGTPEAKGVLESLAKGAEEAELTRQAQASLRRLAGKP
jgi:hypothetical protein